MHPKASGKYCKQEKKILSLTEQSGLQIENFNKREKKRREKNLQIIWCDSLPIKLASTYEH
jgi:hypothetical protein